MLTCVEEGGFAVIELPEVFPLVHGILWCFADLGVGVVGVHDGG